VHDSLSVTLLALTEGLPRTRRCGGATLVVVPVAAERAVRSP
jgi:hypothetical protein